MCGMSFFTRLFVFFDCSRMVVSDDGGLEIDRFKFKDVEAAYFVCPFKMRIYWGKAIDQPKLARMPGK